MGLEGAVPGDSACQAQEHENALPQNSVSGRRAQENLLCCHTPRNRSDTSQAGCAMA